MTFYSYVCHDRSDIAHHINRHVKGGWTFVSITPDVSCGGTHFILLFCKAN